MRLRFPLKQMEGRGDPINLLANLFVNILKESLNQ